VIIYGFLLLLFRVLGKRTLAEVTTFDVALLLIISEATQPGLMGMDNSLMNSMIVITTLLGLDTLVGRISDRAPMVQQVLQDTPLVLIEDGRILQDRLDKEGVDLEEIMAAARQTQGLERVEQIKYAVLERTGGISIIPKQA
jgi:Predicted membrane protein